MNIEDIKIIYQLIDLYSFRGRVELAHELDVTAKLPDPNENQRNFDIAFLHIIVGEKRTEFLARYPNYWSE